MPALVYRHKHSFGSSVILKPIQYESPRSGTEEPLRITLAVNAT